MRLMFQGPLLNGLNYGFHVDGVDRSDFFFWGQPSLIFFSMHMQQDITIIAHCCGSCN